MFKIQDFNPIFKTPNGLIPSNKNNINNNGTSSNGVNLSTNNPLSSSNIPLTPSLSNNYQFTSNSINQSQQQQQQQQQQQSLSSHLTNEKLLTFTNYYKFCCLKNVNCYFYQFNPNFNININNTNSSNDNNNNNNNNNNSNGNNTASSTYEILKYEQLIKNKLKNDYQINDIITWIAKRELCLFQLQIDDPNENFDPNIGFNQLKDAMSNIISENNLSLKLISASTFNSDKLFGDNFLNYNTAQKQLQKKSMNVVYLSFLRAVHKFILQKLTKSHSLFETSTQSLSIDILPYSGQLITSSMIQKVIVTTQNNSYFTTTSKKKKILKKLVPYSILKISPSLNQKNELIINMTSLKKVFYKFTDYINVSCNGSIRKLDEKSKFAIYIAPSGIRCLIAGNSYIESITDEPPENYEKLFNILKTFNDIDLNKNISKVNEKRLWIKIYPVGFNSSNSSPVIANYLKNISSSSKKFIYWPLELCFIQFASDYTPGLLSNDEDLELNNFQIEDPFETIEQFIDILDEIELVKLNQEKENKNNEKIKIENSELQKDILNKHNDLKVSSQISKNDLSNIEQNQLLNNGKLENKSEFKFPVSFNFKPELESIDQQLKPLKTLNNNDIDSIDDIIKAENDLGDLFNSNDSNLNLIDDSKNNNDNDFQKELENVFKNDTQNIDDDINVNNNVDHIDDINNIDNINSIDDSITHDKKVDSNFEDDWDDLFGDSPDDYEKDIDAEVDSVLQDLEESENIVKHNQKVNDVNFSNELDNLQKDQKNDEENDKLDLFNSNSRITPLADTKQNLLTTPSETAIAQQRIDTSPLYQDPGAPSPIPFQIFAPPASSSEESSPISSEEKSNLKPFSSLTPKEKRKSIFAPLNFNPLIEKDIDSKYSNGGKFFVKNNNTLNNLKKIDSESIDSLNNDNKKFINSSNVPLTENSATFNHLGNLTTPSFFVHGPGKKDNYFLSNGDSSSDSEDEILNLADDHKDLNSAYGTDGNKLNENHDVENNNNNIDINIDNSDIQTDTEDNENINDFDDNDDEQGKESYLPDLSTEGNFFGKKNNIFYITASGSEGNPSKRRKLETIFDSINDDDELDLEFDDDYNDDIENDNDQNDIENSDVASKSKTDLDNTITKNMNDVSIIEIPNSWFYVLRPVSPIQVPFNFLETITLKINISKIASLLPILQEYVLFSQKYMNNQMLDMLVQSRECPSVLDNDVEYLIYKIFPGISKMNCFELLDADKESRQLKPFECLFGLATNKVNNSFPNKSDTEVKFFDDNNYDSTSPILSAPQIDFQNNHMTHHYIDEFVDEFQKVNICDSIPSDNLFRINPTIINLKRLDQDIIVNHLGINFWKLLNLEPSEKSKDFSIIFVVPKSNSEFHKRCVHFLNEIIDYYNVCKLGSIEKLNDSGIVEIEHDINKEYWDSVQQKLLSIVDDLQNKLTLENNNKILLMFVNPFQNLNSLVRMADVTYTFESALLEKQIDETDLSKKKKKRKNKIITRLPIILFYKAFSIDSFYQREDGQYVVFTDKDYLNLVLELYNNCPNNETQMVLKDRSNVFLIEKDIQKTVKFMLTKKPVTKLIEDETFLHLCYERSVDKKWCVASWINQSGNLNFTKSWYIDEKLETCQSFEKVADDIMSITMEYVSKIPGKCYVILTRLNNIIPDDELAEWKRLSIKNNDLVLVVMTAEMESSTLILSNNPGQIYNAKKKDDNFKDVNYTVGSTNSQSQTPANFLLNTNNYTHHLVGSAKFESPDVSMYTPSYDNVLSPMDLSTHQVQVPIQPLEPLHEHNSEQDTLYQNPVLIDISDECYGLILQVSQPLSNQPRVPLKTGFLVNTGEGATKNRVLEINLLSYQSGINVNKFLRNLLIQYRNLASLAPFLGIEGIVRKCGNVEYDDLGEEEEDDDTPGNWEDESSAGLGLNLGVNNQGYGIDRNERKKERQYIQQQYTQFHRMQQRQKRQRSRERDRDISENNSHYNVIPVHMLAVRKMLDFLVNIEIE